MAHRLPSSRDLFPKPQTDERSWLLWHEQACTRASLHAILRAIYDEQQRESRNPEELLFRAGVIEGLKKALRVIEIEEDDSKPKSPNSVEGV